MMHFAIIIPDWNSLGSVRRVHSDLEFAALVFFALLVLAELLEHMTEVESRKRIFDKFGIWFFAIAVFAEIVAYPYGQRNDTLSAQVISSLDDLATHAHDEAGIALDTSSHSKIVSDAASIAAGKAKDEADVASKRAEEVDRSLSMTQYLISARQIRDPGSLTKDFRQFKGLAISFRSYPNDPEAFSLCAGFVSVARAAGIATTDQCGAWFVINGETVTNIAVSGPDDKTMLALVKAIGDAQIFGGISSGPYGNAQHSPIYIVFVGTKSPFSIGQARPILAPKKTEPFKKQ